jgi:hypothetical protein
MDKPIISSTPEVLVLNIEITLYHPSGPELEVVPTFFGKSVDSADK